MIYCKHPFVIYDCIQTLKQPECLIIFQFTLIQYTREVGIIISVQIV